MSSAELAVEWGVVDRLEVELELRGVWLHDEPRSEGDSTDIISLDEAELLVRYAAIDAGDFVWTVGLGALAPTGAGQSGARALDGSGVVVATALSHDLESVVLHGGLGLEVIYGLYDLRDRRGRRITDAAGEPVPVGLGLELVVNVGIAVPFWQRDLWWLIEVAGEVEPEASSEGLDEYEVEVVFAMGIEWILRIDDGDEVEPLKLGVAPILALLDERIAYGGVVQAQFEIE